MAEIFLARREGPAGFSKTVVVKRVLPHHLANRDFLEMFLDEARLAAQLEHPNVVHITDFGQVDGRFYLAMEYLRGVDLSALLRARRQSGLGFFPPAIAAAVGAQAAAGLHYAHTATNDEGRALRIVHRDISPSNLFLTIQGVVKVLDFGIAKAEGKLVETAQGLVKGKLMYMSPEQTWGHALDGRADVWALGVVLFELLSGVRPFARTREGAPGVVNERATLEAIDREDPAPLPVDGQLSEIVLRCLAKNREDRYPTAQDLQRDLEDYVMRSGGVTHETLGAFLSASIGTDEVARRSRSAESVFEEVRSSQIVREDAPGPPRESSHPTWQENRTESQTNPSRSRFQLGPLVLGSALVGIALFGAWVAARSQRVELPPDDHVAVAPPAALAVDAGQPEADAEPLPPRDARQTIVDAGTRGVLSSRPKVRGRLRVTCPPFGEVFIDDRSRGRATPSLELEVALGSHLVRCVHPSLGESAGTVAVVAGALAEKSLQY